MTNQRAAGVLLLITALATAISVAARVSSGVDQMAASFSAPPGLSAEHLAEWETLRYLSAIETAKVAYAAAGAALVVGGLTLLAASVPMWRTLKPHHPRAMLLAAALLAASGIASAVSGGCAIALAAIAPEPQYTYVQRPVGGPVGGWAAFAPKPQSTDVQRVRLLGEWLGQGEDTLLTFRRAAGALGFTLAGLALVALGPVQWRMGGVLRVAAVAVAVLGVAMLFIWVDAATVVHRITGIGFLLWLIVAGLWLAAGRVRPP